MNYNNLELSTQCKNPKKKENKLQDTSLEA
ncbi:MAG: hypothetical protein RI977_1035 [Bacteroidota bacterium]